MLVSSVQKNDSVAHFTYSWASLVAQRLKRLPPMRETQVWSLGWEDPLEKEMVAHSSCSCLENPMDGEAWWATVQGVAKSRTRLSDFTFTFILFQILFPFRILQNIVQNSLCYTVSLLVFYFTYSSIYMSIPNSQSLSLLNLTLPPVIKNSFFNSVNLFLFCK